MKLGLMILLWIMGFLNTIYLGQLGATTFPLIIRNSSLDKWIFKKNLEEKHIAILYLMSCNMSFLQIQMTYLYIFWNKFPDIKTPTDYAWSPFLIISIRTVMHSYIDCFFSWTCLLVYAVICMGIERRFYCQ